MSVSLREVRDRRRIIPENKRQMQEAAVVSGKWYRGGGGGVARHFAVRPDKRTAEQVGR